MTSGSCPGDDVALVRRKRPQLVEALQHFPDMEGGRKRPFARRILVEMADIGREHDKPATGPDADELKPGRMSVGADQKPGASSASPS